MWDPGLDPRQEIQTRVVRIGATRKEAVGELIAVYQGGFLHVGDSS